MVIFTHVVTLARIAVLSMEIQFFGGKMNRHSIFLSILLCLAGFARAEWMEIAKSVSPRSYPQSVNDAFGYALAIDGETAVAGVPTYESGRGCAYVMEFDGTQWRIVARLTRAGKKMDGSFGVAVDVSGDCIVVSAPIESAVFVYEKPPEGWSDMTETAILRREVAERGDMFGHTVSVSGNDIVVTARDENRDRGLHLYTRPSGGWVDAYETVLIESPHWQHDIKGAKIDGNTMIAAIDSASRRNSIIVYEKAGAVWTNTEPTASLSFPEGIYMRHGFTVDLDGDVVVAENHRFEVNPSKRGELYVFQKLESGWSDMGPAARLRTTDMLYGNNIGNGVAIRGDAIAATTPSGDVFLFEKPEGGWIDATTAVHISGDWAEVSKGVPAPVALSRDHVLFTVPTKEVERTISHVMKTGSDWSDASAVSQIAQPAYENAGEAFYGQAVSMHGDYAVIGSPGYTCAFVLYYDSQTWDTIAVLTADSEQNPTGFGEAVCMSNEVIAVGASKERQGRVYVYERPIGDWQSTTQTAVLSASDGDFYDFFGSSVAIDGDDIVVGSPDHNQHAEESGAAYLFTRPAQGWIDMTETAKLIPETGTNRAGFGRSVDIDGGWVVVGGDACRVAAPRSDDPGPNPFPRPNPFDPKDHDTLSVAYLFERPSAGWTSMIPTAHLMPGDGNDFRLFGYAVSINAGEVVVAAPHENGVGSYAGALYVFTRPADGWRDTTSTAKLIASDGSPYDRLGWGALSIVENRIVAGAKFANDTAGAVYVFDKPLNGWADTTESAKLTPSDIQSPDRFGASLSARDNRVLIGAPGDYENGPESGSAYLFVDRIPPVHVSHVRESRARGPGIELHYRTITVFSGRTTDNMSVALYSVNGRLLYRHPLPASSKIPIKALERIGSKAVIVSLEHNKRSVVSETVVLP